MSEMNERDKPAALVAIARQRMREAFYHSYHNLDVEAIVDAVEEYVTARIMSRRA
jgi:hypothetical protein